MIGRRLMLALAAVWVPLALLQHGRQLWNYRGSIPLSWRGGGEWLMAALALLDPFSWPRLGHALAGHAGGALLVAAVLAAALGAGSPVLRWMPRQPAVAGLALGLLGLATVLQGLGLAGLWFAPVFAAITGLAFVAGVAGAWRRRRAWIDAVRGSAPEGLWLLGLAAACVLVARLPQGSEDPLHYHWAAPEHYLRWHGITASPGVSNWNIPLPIEMLYGPAIMLLREEGARLVNVALLLVFAAVVWTLAGGAARRREAAWAAWVATGSLFVLNTIVNGKNDIGFALFVPLALAGMFLPVRAGWWVGAGVFAGAAVAAKMVGAVTLAGAALAALLVWRRRPSGAGAAVAGMAAVIVPWFLQLWFVCGSPFYPFAFPQFPDPWWGAEEAAALRTNFLAFAPRIYYRPAGVSIALLLVLNASVAVGVAAPLAFVLRPPAGDGDRRRWSAFRLAIPLTFGLWCLSLRDPRFINPLVPLAAVLVARALWGGPAPLPRIAAVLGGLQIVSCALFLLSDLLGPGKLAYLLGQRTRDQVIADDFTTMETARRWVNEHVPASDAVWLIGEDRRYGYRPRVVSHLTVDQKLAWRWTREAFTPGEIRKRARQAGITHICFNFVSAEYRGIRWYGGRPWDDRQLVLYRSFLERYARLAWRSPSIDYLNGGFCVWRLEPRPGMAEPSPGAAPVARADSGAWAPWYLPGTEGLFNRSFAPWVIEKRSVGIARYTEWFDAVAARMQGVGYAMYQQAQAYDDVKWKEKAFAIYGRLYKMGYPGGGAWHAYARRLLLADREAECVRAGLDAVRLFDRPETRDLVAAGLFGLATRDFKAGHRDRALRGLDASAGIATRGAEVCLALARGYALAGYAPAARRFLARAVEAGARGREVNAVVAGIARIERTGR